MKPSTLTVLLMQRQTERTQPYEERDARWRGVLQPLGGDLTLYRTPSRI